MLYGRATGLLVAALCCAGMAYAAEMPPSSPGDLTREDLNGSEIQIFIENDSFGSSDSQYTNGIKFGIGAPLRTLNEIFRPLSKSTLDLFSDPDADYHLGFFAGQNLYTPRDITIAAPQPLDRPWAAWLYLGGVAQRVQANRLDTVELDLGWIGPPALGKPVQTQWHRLVDAPKPRGWSNQLRSEPGFLLSYLHKRRIGNRNGIELVPHAGVTVGTVMTLARTGGIVRVGHNMTGFGADSIEPGGAMLKNTRREHEGAGRGAYEWFVFAGADYRLVAHNIFLDGNVFRSGPSVDRRVAVHDFMLGASARIESLRLSVTHITRSEEFTTAAGGGGKQQFYSVNIGFEF